VVVNLGIKVVAFNGSPRENGNTARALKIVLAEIEKEGIETELIQLRPLHINECIACYRCRDRLDRRCSQDDDANACIEKMQAADGILVGSPTYFGNIAGKLKCFLDRAFLVSKLNGGLMARKAGAPVIAVRRQGATGVYHMICNYFALNSMFMVGSSYWNMAMGRDPGDIAKDEEGIQTLKDLGRNMAWLLKKIVK
jgi:multimeric flavodoxin WrbA